MPGCREAGKKVVGIVHGQHCAAAGRRGNPGKKCARINRRSLRKRAVGQGPSPGPSVGGVAEMGIAANQVVGQARQINGSVHLENSIRVVPPNDIVDEHIVGGMDEDDGILPIPVVLDGGDVGARVVVCDIALGESVKGDGIVIDIVALRHDAPDLSAIDDKSAVIILDKIVVPNDFK